MRFGPLNARLPGLSGARSTRDTMNGFTFYEAPLNAPRSVLRQSPDFTMSSLTFFASPKTIMVLSM
jgi:hypothetical protein